MKLTLRHLCKRFSTLRGPVEAVRDVSLEVGEGEFFVLLGPSGCGKSTLLNLVAGLEKPTAGEIHFNGNLVAAPHKRIFHPPRQRNVAMVFQSYALYPHLKVFDNIAFPLRVVGEKPTAIHKAVEAAAGMLDIENLLERKPGELSGGQRQRVAIARALVRRPRLFLLDEPLSNLDAQLRTRTRVELKKLQQRLAITTLYVTHDQTEAMTLGDRIALLKNGSIVQTGTPAHMYEKPQTPFAATFIGSPPMNLLAIEIRQEKGEMKAVATGTDLSLPLKPVLSREALRTPEMLIGVRPEHVVLSRKKNERSLPGEVSAVEALGREILLHIRTDCGLLTAFSATSDYRAGDRVFVGFDLDRIHFFARDFD
jgi:multiple sugar transport system ATP-binding protein